MYIKIILCPCKQNKWVCSPSGYNTKEQACQNPSFSNCGERERRRDDH